MTLPRGRRRRARMGGAAISSGSASCPCSRRSSRATSARRLPPSPPEQGEPFRRRAARSRRDHRCPRRRTGSSPRFFAYFANSAAEPGHPRGAARGDAQLGRASSGARRRRRPSSRRTRSTGWRSCSACPTGGTVTSRTRRRSRRSPRSIAARERRPARSVVVCSEHAHSSVETSGADARPRDCARCRVDDAVPHARRRARPRRRARRRRHRRDDVVDRRSIPVRELAALLRRRRASGCTSTPRTRARRGSVPSSVGRRPASSARTRSSSMRTSGCSRRWTARCSGRAQPEALRARRSASCRSTCARSDGASTSSPSTGRARPALPLAQALGGASLLRRARACRRGSAERDPARRAVRRLGARRAGLGALRAARVLGRRASGADGVGRGERATARARRTRAARSSSRTRSSTAATSCGSRSATSARPRTTCGEPGTSRKRS